MTQGSKGKKKKKKKKKKKSVTHFTFEVFLSLIEWATSNDDFDSLSHF